MSLEFNKIAAAVLSAGVAFMGAGIVSEVLMKPKTLSQPAIALGTTPADATPREAAAATPPPAAELMPVGPMLAAANPDTGRTLAQRACAACHSFNEGGRNGVGPNLWNIVNATPGQVAGFNYSDANRGRADRPWDFESLNGFIANPRQYLPGTRMAFAGLANPQQRADVIAFLRSLSNDPAPLP